MIDDLIAMLFVVWVIFLVLLLAGSADRALEKLEQAFRAYKHRREWVDECGRCDSPGHPCCHHHGICVRALRQLEHK